MYIRTCCVSVQVFASVFMYKDMQMVCFTPHILQFQVEESLNLTDKTPLQSPTTLLRIL